MSSYPAKLALCVLLSTTALVSMAHADSSYQPYYYDRDALLFSNSVAPVHAAAQRPAAALSTSNYETIPVAPQSTQTTDPRTALLFANSHLPTQPVSASYSQQIPLSHEVFPTDQTRAALQYNRDNGRSPSGASTYPQPVLDTEPEESFDMGAGLGW